MARNLIKAGYPLVVHNRSRAAVDELVGAGAKSATSPREVAGQCDVLITMLPNSPDVEVVALGKNGIVEGARPGLLFVDMSTISPIVSQKIGKTLEAKGSEIVSVMRSIKGIADLGLFRVIGQPNLQFQVDRKKAARYGLNVADVQEVEDPVTLHNGPPAPHRRELAGQLVNVLNLGCDQH